MEDKVNLDSILVNGNFAILKEEDNSFNFEDLKFIKRSSEPKNKINRLKNFLKLVEIGPKKINGRYYYGYTDDVVSISNIFIAFSFFAFFPVVIHYRSYMVWIPIFLISYLITRLFIFLFCKPNEFKRRYSIFSIWTFLLFKITKRFVIFNFQ